jgi:ubiquinone/menaquinone biosynthesis C-methylase UbiE
MWDYSQAAKHYDNRPPYSPDCIRFLLSMRNGGKVCDVGAGTAILSDRLSSVYEVTAIEPNDEMSKIGKEKSPLISWVKATAENTKQDSCYFDLVTFGSSLNVTNTDDSLREAKRILKNNGVVACLWNYRDFSDDNQKLAQDVILKHLPNYDHGKRRKEYYPELKSHFSSVRRIIFEFETPVIKSEWIDAWNSHLTLLKQAGDKMPAILKDMEEAIEEVDRLRYATHLWVAE